ncbi:MAG: DUF2330 domain-containing protein [Myxococcales bacterium]|nr:DUF2330 domain-containing protein [Myxococcales bacterium]
MRWYLNALATAGLVLAPMTADAFCGFYVSGADGKLFNDATQVVMMRDGTRTVLSMQNTYQGPPENFAMVVPVPVVLQKENVKTLPSAVFERVDQLTSPRLVEYWEQDPCPPPMPREMRMKAGAPVPRPAPPSAAAPGAPPKVRIEAQFVVGEYDIVILSATDATALDTWLRDNKYKIPDGAEPYLRPYVQQGMKFFVAKVDVTKVKFEGGKAVLSPLRFHYDSEQFHLPIRLGLINSNGSQDVIVNILARNQRYEVANYDNIGVPTNIDVKDAVRRDFGSFYMKLFDDTVRKHPKSVVTEYSWQATSCDPCPTPPLSPTELALLGSDVIPSMALEGPGGGPMPPPPQMGPVGPRPRPPGRRPFFGGGSDFVLTRLHARYTKDASGEDLFFKAAAPIVGGREMLQKDGKLERGALPSSVNNFQARYIIRHPWTGAIKCAHPQRGVWGGPPGGRDPRPTPAARLGFAKPASYQLASVVSGALAPETVLGAAGPTPKLVIPALAAMPAGGDDAGAAAAEDAGATSASAPESDAGGGSLPPPPPKSGGCAGCTTTPASASYGLFAGLAALGLALTRRVASRRSRER